MSNLVFNVDMRFIADHTKCYILFPGRSYENYSNIKEEGVVYLDFPGIPLEELELSNKISDWEARITISDRIKKWFSQGQEPSDLPVRQVSDVGSFRSTQRKRLFAGLLNGLFYNLEIGDLVIVPPQDQSGLVLFGEVLDTARTLVRVRHPTYEGETVPARRVRWVAQITRQEMPRWLDAKLPSPNPFRLVERSFYEQIFDLAYERYHYDSKFVCKFHVTNTNFDALSNIDIQQFLLFPAALAEALENFRDDGVYRLIRKNIDRSNAPEQRISINSPGRIVVISRTAASLIAGVFLLASTEQSLSHDKLQKIQIVNKNTSLQSEKEKKCMVDMEN